MGRPLVWYGSPMALPCRVSDYAIGSVTNLQLVRLTRRMYDALWAATFAIDVTRQLARRNLPNVCYGSAAEESAAGLLFWGLA